jgi:cytochrome b involved in lipid metabolism
MAADTPAVVSETVNATTPQNKEFTLDEISKHQSHDDCWLIVGNQSNGT